ncbi:acid shock protein [Alkalilimnicola sp. S0819]|uniref:acid shock protein n=1 Tax=Alkalilimnicola sp. S0819 TaxID=2613922 RepID=UPI001262927C|nr:acid shock protein [Alkalilimnicola sp. S0819]KAB7627843.1 acid shock protein [Alkalilimnicola sp. S0819]MPQ15477.1 hypothetical protein [Alkalilimnicola sp. S0819]
MKAVMVLVMVAALGLGSAGFAADRNDGRFYHVILGSTADEWIPADLGQRDPREPIADSQGLDEQRASRQEAETDEVETTAEAPIFVPFSDPEEEYLNTLG